MEEMLVNLFRLCMEAKECGIDAFFDYAPHVGSVSIQIYKNGCDYIVDENGEFVLDENGEMILPDWDKRFYFYIDSQSSMEEAYKYLQDCIVSKEKAPQGLVSE